MFESHRAYDASPPRHESPSDLKHLVYTSRTDAPLSDEALERLLVEIRHKNRQAGITGVLIIHGNRYMQCLEGPADAVDAAFARIWGDPRHVEIDVRLEQPVERRAFASWDMACTRVDVSLWLRLSREQWETNLLLAREIPPGLDLLKQLWEAQ